MVANGDGLSFMQCAGCASPPLAEILATFEDAVVIIHSPNGCAASFTEINRKYKKGCRQRGLPVKNARLVSTNLTEKDVILGIDKKLEQAVEEAVRRFRPAVIFITASCGAGVTGFEIQTVIDRIQLRYRPPLIAVVCEIYRTHHWKTGFDGETHSVLQKIVKPVSEKSEFYNVIQFNEDDTVRKYLRQTGLPFNFISQFASYASLEKMAQAKATFQLCNSRFGTYIAGRLAKEFGVPCHKVPLPYGIQSTEGCLTAIGEVVGDENVFSQMIQRQFEAHQYRLMALRKQLQGIRCLPVFSDKRLGKAMQEMLNELGVKVLRGDTQEAEENVSARDIARKRARDQGYRILRTVRQQRPDILLVHHYSLTSWGARLGIPTVWLEDEPECTGFDGLVAFGQKLADAVANPHMVRMLGRHAALPYSDWWMGLEGMEEVRLR